MSNSNKILSYFFGFWSVLLFFMVNRSINQSIDTSFNYIYDYNIYLVQIIFLSVMSIMFLIGSIVCYLRDDLSNS